MNFAPLNAVGLNVSSAVVPVFGTASISGVGAVSAAGKVATIWGTGGIAASALISADGTRYAYADGAITASGASISFSSRYARGTAAILGTLSITGTGIKYRPGLGTVTASAAVTSVGTRYAYTDGAIVGSAEFVPNWVLINASEPSTRVVSLNADERSIRINPET